MFIGKSGFPKIVAPFQTHRININMWWRHVTIGDDSVIKSNSLQKDSQPMISLQFF